MLKCIRINCSLARAPFAPISAAFSALFGFVSLPSRSRSFSNCFAAHYFPRRFRSSPRSCRGSRRRGEQTKNNSVGRLRSVIYLSRERCRGGDRFNFGARLMRGGAESARVRYTFCTLRTHLLANERAARGSESRAKRTAKKYVNATKSKCKCELTFIGGRGKATHTETRYRPGRWSRKVS